MLTISTPVGYVAMDTAIYKSGTCSFEFLLGDKHSICKKMP